MLCSLCIFLFFYYRENKVYVDDYYDVIDVKEEGYLIRSYKDFLELEGKPLREEIVNEEKKILYYPDYGVIINESNGNYWAGSILIKNQNICFGKNKIGVGSTKFEVEMAYFPEEVYKIENNIHYIDGFMAVEYFFDDKDVVTKIKICEAEY